MFYGLGVDFSENIAPTWVHSYKLVKVVDPSAPVTEFNVWFKVDSKALRFQWRLGWEEASVSFETLR